MLNGLSNSHPDPVVEEQTAQQKGKRVRKQLCGAEVGRSEKGC